MPGKLPKRGGVRKVRVPLLSWVNVCLLWTWNSVSGKKVISVPKAKNVTAVTIPRQCSEHGQQLRVRPFVHSKPSVVYFTRNLESAWSGFGNVFRRRSTFIATQNSHERSSVHLFGLCSGPRSPQLHSHPSPWQQPSRRRCHHHWLWSTRFSRLHRPAPSLDPGNETVEVWRHRQFPMCRDWAVAPAHATSGAVFVACVHTLVNISTTKLCNT